MGEGLVNALQSGASLFKSDVRERFCRDLSAKTETESSVLARGADLVMFTPYRQCLNTAAAGASEPWR